MENTIKKMDISSLPSLSIPVLLPETSLMPMLRLAHVWVTTPEQVKSNSYVRILGDFEFVFQVEGQAWIWVEAVGGRLPIEAGDLVFIPPKFPHAWGFETGIHIAVHFDLHAQPEIKAWDNIRMLNALATPDSAMSLPVFSLFQHLDEPALQVPLIAKIQPQAMCYQWLENLVKIWQSHVPVGLASQLLINETICRLLYMLDAEKSTLLSHHDDQSKHLIWSLLAKLALNPTQWPTISQLASELGMSQTTFRTTFERIIGCSPRRYIEQQKMEHASHLLIETDSTITQVALAVGYEDLYHFSRVFKRVKGLSPRQFRQKRFL